MIEERCNERSENRVFTVTEYWSTITTEVNGFATISAEITESVEGKSKEYFHDARNEENGPKQ